MQSVIAQIDPAKAAEALLSAASAGDTAKVLAVIVIGMIGLCGLLGRALLAAKDALVQGEKEHSKKVEELLKDGSDVVKETRWLLDEIKNRMPQNIGNKTS